MRFPENELWGDSKSTSNAPRRVQEEDNKHKTFSWSSMFTPLNHREKIFTKLYKGYNRQPIQFYRWLIRTY